MKNLSKKRVKSQKRYPTDLKRKIAKEYLSGAASYAVLADENGLRDKDVVKEFVKWYRRKLAVEPSFEFNMSKVKKDNSNPPTDDRDLEIAKLKEQLRLAELKTEMLETIIDVAEKELEIDIRKKSGTNQ